MRRRGTSNANARGNTDDRRARRRWLVENYGVGRGFVRCWWCARKIRKFEVDRIICGHKGGRYVRWNIVPACPECNRTKCAVQCRVGVAARR